MTVDIRRSLGDAPVVHTTDTVGFAEAVPSAPSQASVATAPVAVPEAYAELEAAARLLVDQLPKHIADYVLETAYVSNRQPLWTVVAGHLLRAYEHGTMTAPILDPAWGRAFGAVGIALADTRYACEWCSKPFTPARFRQRYCSQSCGAAAAAFQAQEEKEAVAR